ncbi:LacI family DNA-binding transcriptional regulator [Fictibacillus enclensis]|uniref:LacI family DNA-binding transcriptional regulator n=1 Tax=Fictibacillus enclensis TaxID=1017270 RepID=UPI0025A01C09|nr:LacI family DNA-binding transcriptional regulator [Fictibacillus enclensis]MDM5336663.1 LacI family DNA-binding transcriptional regulator [Fictibacillus enclensis]
MILQSYENVYVEKEGLELSYTIKDVAKKANVSVATVSRILNNLPGYSEKTKEKVLEVIAEMGYQPNAIARGLINKKTKTLGVLLPAVSDTFASVVLSGIEDMAHELDYSVMVCNTDKDGKRTMKYLQALREKQVDGIVFVSEFFKEEYYNAIIAMNLPVVLVSTKSKYDVPFIKVDDKKAVFDGVTYLLERGHRSIGMIAGTKGDPIATLPRIEGYKRALKEKGIPVDRRKIAFGDFGFESGITAAKELLKQTEGLTAIFCSSDEMAAGALSYLYRMSIRVPDQISIIGYDNTKVAEMAIPPLTTVGQPLYEMGKNAVKMLLDRETGEQQSVFMPHHIVERETVKVIEKEETE